MAALEQMLSQEIIHKLGWALVHFTWQAVLVAIAVAVFLKALRRCTANSRYWVACIGMVAVVVLPVVTVRQMSISGSPAIEPIVVTYTESADASNEQEISQSRPTLEVVPQATVASRASLRERISHVLELALPYIVTAWLTGVFAFSMWHLSGWTQLQWLKGKRTKPVERTLQLRLNLLTDRLRVRRSVRLLEFALVQVPIVVGWLQPAILMPVSALSGLTSDQLDAIIAHELAHIRRHDYIVNILQTLVEILGFYHPAVWWVSRQVRLERENCCDDVAVRAVGDRICYARALATMEDIRAKQTELVLAANGGSLLGRIKRIVDRGAADSHRASWLPPVLLILLVATIVIPTTLALAGRSESAAIQSREDLSQLLFQTARNGDIEQAKKLIAQGADVNAKDEKSRTALFGGASKGHAEMVRLLLENGADVDAEDKFRQRPLLSAIYSKDKETVQALISGGADVSKPFHWEGHAPLTHAMLTGHKDIVRILLESGADLHVKNRYGTTPLHFAAFVTGNMLRHGDMFSVILEARDCPNTIHLAAGKGDLAAVKTFLKDGVDIEEKDEVGHTSLHWAVVAETSEVADFLIANGASVNATENSGITPLRQACFSGKKSVAELLIAKGADVNAAGDDGWTPLLIASSRVTADAAATGVYCDIVELLIENGADVNPKDKEGQTALQWAEKLGHAEIVALLTEHGAMGESLASQDNPQSAKSLHEAAKAGDVDEVKRLIAEGTDVNVTDDENKTPLCVAVYSKGHAEVVRVLLANGAKVDMGDSYGYTPLFYAIWSDDEETVRALISGGAEVNKRPAGNERDLRPLVYAIWQDQTGMVRALLDASANPEQEDYRGWSPLQNALAIGNPHIVTLLANTDDKVPALHRATLIGDRSRVEELLGKGADLNEKDEFGQTALYYALAAGQGDAAKFLLDQGAATNLKARWGRTLLHQASRAGLLEIVQILITKDVPVNTVSGNVATPLHEAVRGGHREIAEFLISKGIQIDGKDRAGRTALRLAATLGKTNLVELLTERGADIGAKTKSGETPLGGAAGEGWVDVVTLLVAKGADIDVRDNQGHTPIDIARQRGHTEIVEILTKAAEARATVDKKSSNDGSPANLKEPKLTKSLHEAAAAGDTQRLHIRSLIAAGADVNARDENGKTPLHHSVLSHTQSIGVTELLLKKGADINARDDDGRTPLDLAMDDNRHKTAALLISRGGNSSLQTAAFVGDMPAVRDFIKKTANVNAKDRNDKTALHYAARRGNRDVVAALLANDARLDEKDKNGDTALHHAARSSNAGVIAFLLENGASVNERNASGCTPVEVHIAELPRREIVDLFLEKGAYASSIYVAAYTGDLATVKNLVERDASAAVRAVNGFTPLRAAVLAGDRPVADFLISKGADVNAQDADGISLLFYAAARGSSDIVDLLIAKGADTDKVVWGAVLGGNNDIIERLLSAGANVQAVGDSGALHVAALKNNLDAGRLLIRHGVPVDVKWLGMTALHYAITDGQVEFCRLLIAEGADVNARNKWDWTPLHTACEHSYRDKVELLLAEGADVNARNEDGKTPLTVAREAGRAEIVALLREHGAKE